MAANSIDLLTKINDEFLTCQICFETYTRPKSLNCQHTFCQKCLEDYLPANSASVTCPTCRCVQPLTEEGITGLKDNFFISSMADMLKTVKEIRSDDEGTSLTCDTCDEDKRKVASARCLDCTDFLCHECATWHVRTKLTRHHKIVPLTEFEMGIHNEELKNRAKIYCTLHEGEIAKIYCLQCQCPVCHECMENEHRHHTRCSLKEEVGKQVVQVEKLLKRSSSKAEILHNLQASLKEIIKIKKSDRDRVHQTIERSCEAFINAILRRKQELIDELQCVHQMEIKHISADEDSVELQLSSLVSCSEFTQKVLEYGTPKEVLGLNNQMTLILQQLIETHPALTYHKIDQIESIEFNHNPDSCSRVVRDHLGRISKRRISIDDRLRKVLIELDTYCVNDVTHDGDDVKNSPSDVMKQMNYPTAPPGDGLSEVALLGQIGKQGMGDGEFESTPNIAVNSADEIITSDYDGTKIQIFHPGKEFKDSFITEMDQKIFKPTGVAILSNDDVAVCCETSVNIWTHEGKSVTSFGHGLFHNCTCICVNSHNRIIVADAARHVVSVHTETGKLIHEFGGGKTENKLIDPRYIACDTHNNIIVSDSGDCSIKKFSPQGEFLLSFGSEGPERGQFQGPRGVCTDRWDNILVSDCWNHRVDLFTPDGCFVKHIATKFDNLHFPWCISLTSKGRLVLSEDYSWSFKIFDIPDQDLNVSMEDLISSNNPMNSSSGNPMKDFGPGGGFPDIPNIFSNKVSWWLSSSALHNSKGDSSGGKASSSELGKSHLHHHHSNLSSKISSSSDSDSLPRHTTSGQPASLGGRSNVPNPAAFGKMPASASSSLKKSHSFMMTTEMTSSGSRVVTPTSFHSTSSTTSPMLTKRSSASLNDALASL